MIRRVFHPQQGLRSFFSTQVPKCAPLKSIDALLPQTDAFLFDCDGVIWCETFFYESDLHFSNYFTQERG
jgi:hypothetical protein